MSNKAGHAMRGKQNALQGEKPASAKIEIRVTPDEKQQYQQEAGNHQNQAFLFSLGHWFVLSLQLTAKSIFACIIGVERRGEHSQLGAILTQLNEREARTVHILPRRWYATV